MRTYKLSPRASFAGAHSSSGVGWMVATLWANGPRHSSSRPPSCSPCPLFSSAGPQPSLWTPFSQRCDILSDKLPLTLVCPQLRPRPAHTPKRAQASWPRLTIQDPCDVFQEAQSPQPAEKDKRSQRSRLSLTERLRDLQQQIEASRQEESACKLKLSAMMSIVED